MRATHNISQGEEITHCYGKFIIRDVVACDVLCYKASCLFIGTILLFKILSRNQAANSKVSRNQNEEMN